MPLAVIETVSDTRSKLTVKRGAAFVLPLFRSAPVRPTGGLPNNSKGNTKKPRIKTLVPKSEMPGAETSDVDATPSVGSLRSSERLVLDKDQPPQSAEPEVRKPSWNESLLTVHGEKPISWATCPMFRRGPSPSVTNQVQFESGVKMDLEGHPTAPQILRNLAS
jgi:hypothetical protein